VTDKKRIVRLCKAAQVSPQRPLQLELAGVSDTIAVYNVGGVFYATEDSCSHGLAPLSQGEIVGERIYCPLHGGAFDIKTGKPVEYPCSVPIRTYRAWQEGDDVYAEIDG